MQGMKKRFKTVHIVLVVAIAMVIGFIVWRLSLGDGTQVPAVQDVNDLTKLEQQLNGASIEDAAENDIDAATTF